MDKFSVGQRVKRIANPADLLTSASAVPVGTLGTVISGRTEGLWGEAYGVRYDTGSENDVYYRCIVPIDDDADYERFMDCVMKPVNLDQPVTA